MKYKIKISSKQVEDPSGVHRRNLIRILADLYLDQAQANPGESELEISCDASVRILA